jgi:hypothetical protein
MQKLHQLLQRFHSSPAEFSIGRFETQQRRFSPLPGVPDVTLVSDMAHYIVRAKPKPELLGELHQRLREDAFIDLRPFGKALTHSLNEARLESDGIAIWEEEDYCSPPLAQERAAVLDMYFDDIAVERVNEGEGWKRIESLPKLNMNV